jgi:programmed cell death 6-interacting protein
MDILDQEASENESLLTRQPHLASSRQPSHIANQHLINTAGQYDATIKQASTSDGTVRSKWEEWSHLVDVLAGGEVRDYEAQARSQLIPCRAR